MNRRNFLRTSLGGILLAGAPAIITSTGKVASLVRGSPIAQINEITTGDSLIWKRFPVALVRPYEKNTPMRWDYLSVAEINQLGDLRFPPGSDLTDAEEAQVRRIHGAHPDLTSTSKDPHDS